MNHYVAQHLENYLHEHWSVLRSAQFKHPAFGFRARLKKILYEKQTTQEDSHGA